MYRLSILIVFLLLTANLSVKNAYSVQNDSGWQIGVHSNYHSYLFFENKTFDYNFWGGGIDIKKQLNNRFFIGAGAYFYMPINRTQQLFNTSQKFDKKQFMYSIFSGANIYSTDFYSIYSTLGYQYKFESVKGERLIYYCATPYSGSTTQTYDFNTSHHGLRFGTGISFNLNSIHFFAEPGLLVFDGIDFSLSSGIRLSVW